MKIKQCKKNNGKIEIICGGMYSGKTEELIRRVKRTKYAKQNSVIFKPTIDDRYSIEDISTHDGQKLKSCPVDTLEEVVKIINDDDYEIIAFDEITFFPQGITELIDDLANNGYKVIGSGLDQDYLGRPFDIMANCLAIADDVTKLHAVCVDCGKEACKSKRIIDNDNTVVIGSIGVYKPVCRKCYNKELKSNYI